MSDKKLNAIKEIEFRTKRAHDASVFHPTINLDEAKDKLNEIDNLLFDIQDFIIVLKDE
jgi:hypothetical protein